MRVSAARMAPLLLTSVHGSGMIGKSADTDASGCQYSMSHNDTPHSSLARDPV